VSLLGVPQEKDLTETVNTGEKYYRDMNITYCGLPTMRLKINKYLLSVAKFIHKALKNPESVLSDKLFGTFSDCLSVFISTGIHSLH